MGYPPGARTRLGRTVSKLGIIGLTFPSGRMGVHLPRAYTREALRETIILCALFESYLPRADLLNHLRPTRGPGWHSSLVQSRSLASQRLRWSTFGCFCPFLHPGLVLELLKLVLPD